MLTSIRIQNFRSIRDASVKLGQVNLFIGPNNSGKSNFLKGISLMGFSLSEYPSNNIKHEYFLTLLPRTILFKNLDEKNIRIVAQTDNADEKAVSLLIGYDFEVDTENPAFVYSSELSLLPNIQSQHNFTGIYNLPYEDDYYPSTEVRNLIELFKGTLVYKLEPASFDLSAPLSHQLNLSTSGKNIVNFLYYLGQNYKGRYRSLEADFANCVKSLVSISTPADPDKVGNLRLKFFDENDISYWAEEVSEGVLYFLALLCIVHQPNPPKLLLLEEPEKGIHPRRIKEVMNFIFELARLRDIQIVLTSHSPYVVDHFADIPECISVFDRKDGETVIHNAADIIEETNSKLNKPIRYSDALGEHWVSGFLGGVPV
jgi:energy-coupling factor transporter ATP-binding protein EcfA2